MPETPPAGYEPPKPSSELRSLVKQVAYDNIKASVQAMFTGYGLEASETEIADIASLSCDMAAVDIAEVYSPQRFTAEAERFKLRSGFAIDLCEQKPSGEYWDMTKPEDVKLAWELLKKDEPLLLTGSPPCHMFSQLQNISWSKIAPEIRKKRMDEALHHLHTSVDLYEEQYRQGRYFLHEAPWSATSWKDPKVVELASKPGVYTVRGPMCRWGMQATDRRGLQGTGYVRKETGWMTNHPELAAILKGEWQQLQGQGAAQTHPPCRWNRQAGGGVSAEAGESSVESLER